MDAFIKGGPGKPLWWTCFSRDLKEGRGGMSWLCGGNGTCQSLRQELT